MIMRQNSIVSRIILTLPVITLALAAPVLVQEKRQAPEDVINVLEEKIEDSAPSMLHDPLGYYEYM